MCRAKLVGELTSRGRLGFGNVAAAQKASQVWIGGLPRLQKTGPGGHPVSASLTKNMYRVRWAAGMLSRLRPGRVRGTEAVYRAAGDLVRAYPGLADASHPLEPFRLGPSALRPYELRVTSQNGEDGVLAELLARTEVESRIVVEFGAGDGSETTTGFLLDWCGWGGLLIEADRGLASRLSRKYMHESRVTTVCDMVGEDNLNDLLRASQIPPEFAVLSIDIDSTDYWVWRSLRGFRPRIVVVEYNASLAPGQRLTVPRDYRRSWDGVSNRFGASLSALETLARSKGYALVHTDLAGVNAFFVRGDLADRLKLSNGPRRAGPNWFLASEGPQGD